MRIGVNGTEAAVGQAYRTVDTTITDSQYGPLGQPLATVGTIIGLEKGPESDEFFLTFDVLGTHRNVRLDPVPLAPAPPPDVRRAADVGLRVFDEINATMSELTGVSAHEPGGEGDLRLGEAGAADRREHRHVRLGAPGGGRAARDPVLQRAGGRCVGARCVLPGIRLQRGSRVGVRRRAGRADRARRAGRPNDAHGPGDGSEAGRRCAPTSTR